MSPDITEAIVYKLNSYEAEELITFADILQCLEADPHMKVGDLLSIARAVAESTVPMIIASEQGIPVPKLIKYSKLFHARAAQRLSKISVVILVGKDGYYWLVTPEEAVKLQRRGFQVILK